MKFKKGDLIKITSGKDKGRQGKIERIYPKKNTVLIPEINIYKKHIKGVGEQKGGIYDIPRALSVAKIALICPKCKKVTRIGFKLVGQQKVRICKKCRKEIDLK